MLSHRFAGAVCRECREWIRILPILGLAVILASAIGPTLISVASTHFESPVSPISPSKQPSTSETPAALPTQPTQAVEEIPQEVIPPAPAPDIKPEATTPPTLWVLAGLVGVGAIVGSLVVFRKG